MWFPMRPVDLDFLQTAGRSYRMECELRAPRPVVWQAYVDPTTWPHWFPGVESACYVGSEPYGVGTQRLARVSGHRYEERIVAWESERRWAYCIEGASVPIARAQLECTEFEDSGSGTRLRWVLAADRRLLLWLLDPFLQRHLPKLFHTATRRLDAYLAETQSESRPGKTVKT